MENVMKYRKQKKQESLTDLMIAMVLTPILYLVMVISIPISAASTLIETLYTKIESIINNCVE